MYLVCLYIPFIKANEPISHGDTDPTQHCEECETLARLESSRTFLYTKARTTSKDE